MNAPIRWLLYAVALFAGGLSSADELPAAPSSSSQQDATPPQPVVKTTTVTFEVEDVAPGSVVNNSPTTNTTNIANVNVLNQGVTFQFLVGADGYYTRWNHQYCGEGKCWWAVLKLGTTLNLTDHLRMDMFGLVGAAPSTWVGASAAALGFGANLQWLPETGFHKRLAIGPSFTALFDVWADGNESNNFFFGAHFEVNIGPSNQKLIAALAFDAGYNLWMWHQTIHKDGAFVGFGFVVRVPDKQGAPSMQFPSPEQFKPAK